MYANKFAFVYDLDYEVLNRSTKQHTSCEIMLILNVICISVDRKLYNNF